MMWRTVDVEELIGEDHAARAIWEFTGTARPILKSCLYNFSQRQRSAPAPSIN